MAEIPPAPLAAVWCELTGPAAAPPVQVSGQAALPGAFRVADAAVASVGVALAAGARWLGARTATLDAPAAGLAAGAAARREPIAGAGRVVGYGDTGPWAGRRGFDSLVQTVNGMAFEGMRRAGADRLVPLPAQALDHASGWLFAAGVLHALTLRCDDGVGRRLTVVLARTGEWIDSLGRQGGTEAPDDAAAAVVIEQVASALGVVTRAVCPGALDGTPLSWAGAPSPLGSAEPSFAR